MLTWRATALVLQSGKSVYNVQYNNNVFQKGTHIWDFYTEDSLNLAGRNSDDEKFYVLC